MISQIINHTQNNNGPVTGAHSPGILSGPPKRSALAPLRQNFASLEGHNAVPPRLHLAWGLDAPSGDTPPRSTAGHPLGWDYASLQGSCGSAAPATTPPTKEFNVLTQHKRPSKKWIPTMPSLWHHLGIISRHCFANPPCEAIPATVRHCALRPVSAPWHCAAYSRTARTPHARKRTVEPLKKRQTPILRPHGTTSWRRTSEVRLLHRHRPCAAIRAATPPSRALQHHPRHCGSPGWQDIATYATVRPPALRQPDPRADACATTKGEASTPLPSKPLLDEHRVLRHAPPEARFSRTAVYSMALYTIPLQVAKTMRHNCKLHPLGLWREGAVPQPRGRRWAHTCKLSAFTTILSSSLNQTSGTWRNCLLSRLACSSPLQAP
jgi:hypothetical protein